MNKTRMSLAVLTLGTLVWTGAAFAQAPPNPTGKASVEIKDAQKPAATAAPAPAAAAAPASSAASGKSGTARDPFVETLRGTPRGVKGAPVKVVNNVKKKDKTVAKAPEVKEQVAPPPVAVHGIIESPKGNMAILVGPNNTWIVRSGDKLGDYHVTKIGHNTVAFSYEDKVFKLPLMTDPLAGGASKKGGHKK